MRWMAWRGRRWLWAGLVLSGLLLVLGSSAARAAAAPAKPAPSKPTPAASSEFPWVLFKGSDSTLAGSDEDWQRASSLAKSPSERFLWFRRDDREYLVRDLKSLSDADKLLKSVTKLLDEQRSLSDEESRLTSQQEQLATQQDELSGELTNVAEEITKVTTEMAKVAEEGDPNLEALQDELNQRTESLAVVQDQLASQQQEISTRRYDISRRQQEILGLLDEAMRSVRAEMARLIDRLLDQGKAEAVSAAAPPSAPTPARSQG